jgi:indolepyruvate ferredoxin oxidoreductase
MADGSAVALNDKYLQTEGQVFLSGMQALVRLPMLQRVHDAKFGLRTAGFVSGYRGSPVGGYDRELWRARDLLEASDIRFQPGLNEDLAATSCWGTQQLGLLPGARYDGVFALWYGKNPGLDRSTDAIKHATHWGTAPLGGVLAVVGDDQLAKSSAFGHQSEFGFVDCLMPVLAPSNVEEILSLGLAGWAMSRYCGSWVGFKIAGSTCETSATVTLPDATRAWRTPDDFAMPPEGVHIRWPDDANAIEARQKQVKLPAAQAFAFANGLDRVKLGARPGAKIGVIAPGRAYHDVRQALRELGLSEEAAERAGLRLYKPALVWPLEPRALRSFAEGLETVLVVEDKRPLVEDQVKTLLYDARLERPPRVIGKKDAEGKPLLPDTLEVDPLTIALALGPLLGIDVATLAAIEAKHARMRVAPPLDLRTPYFCSGCPHNTSTVVPDESLAIGGIGCHTLAMFMDRSTVTFTHMGGEGASWIGLAPFTDLPHVFQNIGDGTYQHSGSLGIRAAVAAGVTMTFKLLYNDAVAMTGGQKVEGGPTVPQITRQLAAEGVETIAVVTDEPTKYGALADFAPGVSVHHRDELDQVQRELRGVKGVSVLVYDQTCAAEKRRRRKRNAFPDPAKRVVINELVCEGCGDCGVQSNCLSIVPVETPFGRKRQIDQASCNKDYSCVKGFCPSFVTVEGGQLRREPAAGAAHSVEPPMLPSLQDRTHTVLIVGIGGTGIVTVGAILGMAARIEGKAASVNDVTGMAQKGGPVLAHVTFAAREEDLTAERIGIGDADALIAADTVVATMPDAFRRLGPRTHAVVSSDETQTGSFPRNADARVQMAALVKRLRERVGTLDTLPANRVAGAATGDPITAGLLLLGFAFQRGLIPLTAESIKAAVRLNNVQVTKNLSAFAWGRTLAAGKTTLESLGISDGGEETLAAMIAQRVAFLTSYQNARYAARYAALVERARAAEDGKAPGRDEFARAVARYAFKLMAYKDEYEVARLHSDRRFHEKIARQFEGDYKLAVHLAPPVLSQPDPVTGKIDKRRFGPWMFKAFPLLAKLKFLRGTAFDLFGRTAERRTERALIEEYFALVETLCSGLSGDNHHLAVQIASIPEKIRGYGHVKARHLNEAKKEEAALLALWHDPRVRREHAA